MVEYGIENGDKVEKYHVALLFKDGANWKQIAKATENTISLNAETEDLDFIVDKSPTTIIKRYKPSLNNPLTLYKGDDDYNYFWPKFYNLPTGASANGEFLIVFLNEPTGNHKYAAWKCDVTYVLDSLDPVNSQLTFTVNVNGTTDRGQVTVTSGVPTFESDATSEFVLTVTVTDGAGAKVMLGGSVVTADADGVAKFTIKDGELYTLGAELDGDKYAEVFTADADTPTKTVTLS